MPIIALAVFFLSGVAALLYQVVWQRLLVLFSGSDVYSTTLIVAAFMAGLGVGHLTGGHLADRSSRRASLLLFAVAELAIAVFGLLSRSLYYDLLYQRLGPLAIPPPAVAALLFASLLWPTFFMGMSLPLLARALTEHLDRAAKTVGTLYGFNTLGAASGALATTWLMLPRFGLEGSLWIGALLNLICAAAVLCLVPQLSASRVSGSRAALGVPPDAGPVANSRTETTRVVVWGTIYGLSGFLALSLEIVWFRLLGVMVKSTAFTFGTLLAIYLAGLGAGSLVGARCAGRLARPASTFLALQAAAGLSAAFLFAGLVGIFDDVTWFSEYFANYEPLDVQESVRQLRDQVARLTGSTPTQEDLLWQFIILYFVLPAFLIVPPTFLMGLSFPVLQRVVQTDSARLARRVGFLLLTNIAGSVVGALVTGLLALNLLGAAGTMKALTVLSGGFAAMALWRLSRDRALRIWRVPITGRAAMAAAGGTVLLSVILTPDAATLWAQLHGTGVDHIVFGEDATGLSVLRLEPDAAQARTTVFANGAGQSAMPYGDIHTALGMLPAFIHPDPKEVAIIGLGSGGTLYGAAGRQQIETITCIEIIRPQLETLKQVSRVRPYGGLLGLLNDPRIEHVAADGRLALMHSAARFDIIEADALRPTSAYSGNLLSVDYFTLVRNRLRPNGLAATWEASERVHHTFVRVFPYVLNFPGILLGSTEPIAFDRELVASRLAEPLVRDHYARAGIDVGQIIATYLVEQIRYTPDSNRDALVNFNTDLFPKDEYDLTPPRQAAVPK